MSKTKPVSLLHQATASMLVALMALPNFVVAETLRQIALAAPEPGVNAPRVTLQLAPPPGATGQVFVVQTSTNLVDWQPLTNASPNQVQLLSVGPLMALDPARFFRAATLAGEPPARQPLFAAVADDSGRAYVFPYLGDRAFGPRVEVANVGGGSRGVAIGDFDRDGNLDVVASFPGPGNTFRTLLIRGRVDGSFAPGELMPAVEGSGGHIMDMAVGDFDADGNLDVAINGNSDTTALYWGRGDGTFTVTTVRWPGTGRGMTAGDFNEDGRTDLVRASYSDGNTRLYLSNGDRTFAAPILVGRHGSDPYGVASADFDQDGHLDVIANAGGNGDIIIYQGFGDGTFTNLAASEAFAPLDFNDYAALDPYDFDGDGFPDMVVATYGGRAAYFVPGAAGGGFETNRVTLATGLSTALGAAAPPPPPRVEVNLAPLDPVIDLNGQVTFTAVGAGVQAGDTFRWTFGDEGDNPLAWSFTPDMANMGPTVTHQFEREGRFVTRLWHTDARGIHSARGTWVTVKGQPPVAQPGGPYIFGEDKAQALLWTATLDGSASTDDFGIVRYEWDFGDGTKGTNSAPVISKSWNGVGPWDVTLVVEDASGLRGTNVTTVTFVPGEAPVARITGPALVDETAAKDGQWTVNFSAAASTDDVGLWKYEWQFGDGKTAAGRDVTTRYGAVGTYTVTLTVTDHAGQTNAVTHDVTIKANEPPVPVITGPRLLTETVATNGLWYGVWNARASTDDTGIYRYEWNFGDGGTATGIEVAYQYKRAGTYPLTLKVTDNGNQTATVEINVLVVPGESPVARITASPLAPEGRQPVAFSAERSSDDRGITSYRWLFPPRAFDFAGRVLDADQWISAGALQDERVAITGQGQWGRTYFFSLPTRLQRGGSIEGRVDTSTGTSHTMVGLKNLDVGNGQYSAYPYAIYFEDGRLSIYEYGSRRQIVGNYTKGESYDFRIQTLPGAGAEYFLRRSGVGEDFALVFSSNQRDDAAFSFGADVHSGTFGFDDFTVTGAFVSAMTVSAPVFPGGPVRLEVVDHAWQTNSTTVTITPRVGQPPRAVINGPTTGQAGVVLNFDGYRSTDDHGIASYSWDFGDGTPPGAGPAVNHRYDAPGTYTNTLTVLDYANQPATAQLVVEITAGNAVACVPWRIINGVEQPHETFSGKEVTLKAVARNLPLPFDYIWNFGDGTGTVTNTATTVAQAYALEARHVYSGTEGTPFYATITVVLTNGVTLGDTYPLVLRPKSLTTEMNVAIDEGLWYLHKIQTRTDGDGQNLSGHWPAEGHTVNPTASAIQAFGINGHQYADDVAQDPYVETVQRGVHFLLNSLTTQGIGPQPYGDPDGNQNGIALFAPTAHPIYETGPLMDAFVACVRPELIAPVGPANVRGRAFRDIMQDLVDIYTWGQYDDATVGGGWRYGWNQHPDNSAAQWGAIGLLAAEHYWGSIVPQWVKDRNVVWVNYSKGGTGFGYTGPGDGEATTPSAMVQLAWAGVARTNALWQHGETYLARNWNTLLNNYNLYGHYAIAKALRTAVPEPVQNLTWQGATWDWFLDPQRGLGRFTVDRQRADGSWTSRDGWVDEPPIATAYSVIILSSSLFQRGPVAVIQFRPNPSAVGFPVVFDARASYHQHPAYQVVEYRWDFNAGDGLDFSRPDAVGPVVTNTYSALGTNVVTLQVRDNNVPVLTDIASVEVRTTIPPFPPTADAGGPYVVAVGEDLQLDGSGSFDVDAAAGDYLTAWDWEVDFEMPLDFDDGVTGEKAVLAGGFATAGLHRIGLRVSDATSIVFPELGLTNLTADDFTSAFVYERVVTDLRVRPKENKIQLTWTKAGDYAVVLRSTVGPQRGFVEIGRTESDYATFLDTNVVMGVEYFYRLLVYSFSRPDPLGVSDVRLAVSRPRDADNRPPAFLSTPLRLGQVGRLYEVTLEAADPDGDVLSFGVLEGPTNLTVNPATGLVQFTPTEDQLGSQTLSFEVRAEGGRDVLTYSVVVFPADNAAPTASANGPYVAVLGEPIQFSSAGTADPDGHNLRIIWNFGDGRSSTNANPVHVYTAAGNYLASLFVNDGYGGTATARANVSILRPNRAPTAVIAGGPAFAIRLGETLTLDGTGSSDLDGDELTFTWNWGDGESDAEAPSRAAHTYAAQGSFDGQLLVADGRGGVGTANFTVTVGPANRPPVVVATVSDPSPLALTEITFDATATTDADGDPLTFEWDFGDRTRTTGPLVTHTFREVGDYVVTLRVRDGRGGEAWETFAITARNSPATITSQPPLLVRAGQPYRYLPDVTDLNGDSFTFELAQGPATMTVNPGTGAMDWLPGDADVGPNPVVLRVTDSRGDATDQSWTLVVTTPLGPELDLEPLAIVMTNVTVDPQTLALGGTVRVDFRNNGADEVPVPFTVTVFVDADANGQFSTNTDPVVAVGNVPAGLRQGFVAWIEIGLRGQALFAGAPLSAYLDSENVVPEYDEANNIRRAGFNADTNVPPVVDLTASFLRVDRSGLPEKARLTARLGNAGLVPVAAGVPLAFYNGDPLAGGALLGVAHSAGELRVGTFEDLTIEWLGPPIAAHTVFVVADDQGDGTGLYAEISETNNRFSAVADLTANEPPVADAGPDQRVAIGDYAVFNGRGSRDPEGKPLTYRWSVISIPVGSRAVLNAVATEQAWLQPDVVGEYAVQLIVNDGVNDSQPVTVRVVADDPSANHPPAITSTPAFEGMTTVLYEYALQANDPDGDPLKYRLAQAPAGMTVDPNSGLIRWTPTAAGSFFVQAIVEDNRGAGRYQSWSVTVREYQNLPPRITSSPVRTASPGVFYSYTVTAEDPNRDPITFALAAQPAGMAINPNSGVITWVPTAAQFGSHPVTVTASDGKGGAATQRFDVVVFDAATDGPVVRPIPDQTVIGPAPFVAIPLDNYVFDPNDPKEALTWTVTGTSQFAVSIDENRVATVTYPAGTLASERLTFLATDPAGKSGFAAATFTVRGRDNPPIAALANLSDTETTRIETGFFELRGTADDPDAIDAVAYRVTLHDENGAQVADVTPKPVNAAGWREGRVPAGGSLGMVDLTRVLDGTYSLLLQVRGGEGTASAYGLLALESPVKPGRFTFDQFDLGIKVQGADLRVVRTYDSFNPREGDFGYGWTYSVSDLGVTINEDRVREVDLSGESFSLRTGGGRDVTLTLPDSGRRVTFRYSLQPWGMFRLRATWTPPAGVKATLVPTVSPNQVVLWQLRYWEAAPLETGLEGFDFPGFILSLEDGTEYRIEREAEGVHWIASGSAIGSYVEAYGKPYLRRITTSAGERTEFVRDRGGLLQITQYDATNQKLRSLLFQRDERNRITAVFTPDQLDSDGRPSGPPAMTYQYSPEGNLVRANKLRRLDGTNGVYATTSYFYENHRFPHYITEIRDPNGNSTIRSQYDSEGRLVGIIDANGNRIAINRDLAGRTETVYDARGNPTVYAYDERGNVVATVDALGGTIRRTFDAQNRMIEEVNPLGHTNRFTYDAEGRLLSRTDALGHTSRRAYDTSGRLVSEVDPLGRETRFEYDDNGRQTGLVSPRGGRDQMAYNDRGLLVEHVDSMGSRTTFDWDSRGNLAGYTDPLGRTGSVSVADDGRFLSDRFTVGGRSVEYNYDYQADGQLTAVVLPNGATATVEYDISGFPARSIDTAGATQEMTYDAKGDLLALRDVAGGTTRLERDAAGQVIRVSNALGQRVERVLDPLGRPATVYMPTGEELSLTYDAAGRITRQTRLATGTRDYEYDAADRLVRSVRSDGAETRYEYDAAGQVKAIINPLGHITSFVYDADGNLTETRFPDGNTVVTQFDLERRLTRTIDERGATTTYSYNAGNLLTRVEDASGGATSYQYDDLGKLAEARTAGGATWRYAYDELGNRLAVTNPWGGSETREYDLAARITRIQDGGGLVSEFTYSPAGLLLERKGAGNARESFVYGPNNQLLAVTNASGVTRFIYDTPSRLTRIEYPNGLFVEFTYDVVGRLVGRRTPGGETTYHYDQFGQLARVVDTEAGETEYAYDALGQLRRVRLPDGSTRIYLRNSRGWATETRTSAADGTLLWQEHITYDPSGNPLHVSEDGREVVYSYDAAGRLMSETRTGPDAENSAFEYDADWNPVRLGSRTLSYDGVLRLTSDGRFTSYSYDGAGRPLERSNGSVTERFAYDALGRLERLERIGAAPHRVDLQYDHLGLLVRITSDGKTRDLLWDATQPVPQLLEERDETGRLLRRYVHGLGPIAVASDQGGVGIIHPDRLGSVRQVTGRDGMALSRFTYAAYGEQTSGSGDEACLLRYAGEYYVPELGLYFLRSRFYDPVAARFLTPDVREPEARAPQSFNPYLYALANPARFKDPLGTFSVAQMSVGLAIVNILVGIALPHFEAPIVMVAKRLGLTQADAQVGISFALSLAKGIATGGLQFDFLYGPNKKLFVVWFFIGGQIGTAGRGDPRMFEKFFTFWLGAIYGKAADDPGPPNPGVYLSVTGTLARVLGDFATKGRYRNTAKGVWDRGAAAIQWELGHYDVAKGGVDSSFSQGFTLYGSPWGNYGPPIKMKKFQGRSRNDWAAGISITFYLPLFWLTWDGQEIEGDSFLAWGF